MEAVLSSKEQVKKFLTLMYQEAMAAVAEGKERIAVLKRPTRSTRQNALMWAMLGDVSRQVIWHGQRLTPEEWKDVLTAGIKAQKVVPGVDGGFVVLGSSTRRMDSGEMTELIEFIEHFGGREGVKFRAPAWMEP